MGGRHIRRAAGGQGPRVASPGRSVFLLGRLGVRRGSRFSDRLLLNVFVPHVLGHLFSEVLNRGGIGPLVIDCPAVSRAFRYSRRASRPKRLPRSPSIFVASMCSPLLKSSIAGGLVVPGRLFRLTDGQPTVEDSRTIRHPTLGRNAGAGFDPSPAELTQSIGIGAQGLLAVAGAERPPGLVGDRDS